MSPAGFWKCDHLIITVINANYHNRNFFTKFVNKNLSVRCHQPHHGMVRVGAGALTALAQIEVLAEQALEAMASDLVIANVAQDVRMEHTRWQQLQS
jgi:hypothetical protein